MRELPGFSVRAACSEDGPELLALLQRCTRTYLRGERASIEEVEDRLQYPGSDPALDTVVVERDREIVGFAHVFTEPPHEDVRCFARVDPAHIGRGVGSTLLDWARRRAPSIAERRPPGCTAILHVTQWARDVAADALLTGRGFRPVRYLMLMTIDLGGAPVAVAPVPEGASIRACMPTDLEVLHRLHAEAFEEHWGRTEIDLDRWLGELTVDGRYDAELWRLAVAEGTVVGFALARAEMPEDPSMGYVDALGVLASWRGRGLGLALLTDVFGVLQSRRVGGASLHVDAENTTGAVALYQRAGMSSDPSLVIWELPIP